MNRLCRATICLATLLAIRIPSRAKGDMVLIEIMGGNLPSTLKITDPKIADFNIWAGPGVNGAGLEQAEGFIINWKAGLAPQPRPEIEHYQVAFYAGCRTMPDNPGCLAQKPRLAYVVLYEYDRQSNQGFVYLPRIKEPWGAVNGGSIHHGNGIEGHWFYATDAWQNFVAPILDMTISVVPPL
ncbi:MAG TPA: hypothetical protein VK789_20630 [Bryobacteraceae bacterium]|nr:hypothetical protein [Bryobacteraceae bacterium]